MNRQIGIGILIASILALSACSHKPPQGATSLPAPDERPASPDSDYDEFGNYIGPGSQADFVAKMRGQDVIYFDTDRYNIDDVDAAALKSQAQWLMQYPDRRARIEGHADERGTREYNLGLGERRANAAKNFLVSVGISASRLTTISYGKERPVALGSDETTWAQNRRAVTITTE